MNPPANKTDASPPWLLLLGLLLGAGFVVYMGWSSFGPSKSANVLELTPSNWRSEVVDSKIPVLVDFTAEWCPPCQAFAPVVERLADRYKGKVKVARFDVGDREFPNFVELRKSYKHLDVRAIPLVMIFDGGDKPHASFNPRSENELAQRLDAVLAAR
jgi:thioredoxin 1